MSVFWFDLLQRRTIQLRQGRVLLPQAVVAQFPAIRSSLQVSLDRTQHIEEQCLFIRLSCIQTLFPAQGRHEDRSKLASAGR